MKKTNSHGDTNSKGSYYIDKPVTHLEKLKEDGRYHISTCKCTTCINFRNQVKKTCQAILKDDEENESYSTIRRYEILIENIEKGLK